MVYALIVDFSNKVDQGFFSLNKTLETELCHNNENYYTLTREMEREYIGRVNEHYRSAKNAFLDRWKTI